MDDRIASSPTGQVSPRDWTNELAEMTETLKQTMLAWERTVAAMKEMQQGMQAALERFEDRLVRMEVELATLRRERSPRGGFLGMQHRDLS
jgi:hypothetical protein